MRIVPAYSATGRSLPGTGIQNVQKKKNIRRVLQALRLKMHSFSL